MKANIKPTFMGSQLYRSIAKNNKTTIVFFKYSFKRILKSDSLLVINQNDTDEVKDKLYELQNVLLLCL